MLDRYIIKIMCLYEDIMCLLEYYEYIRRISTWIGR